MCNVVKVARPTHNEAQVAFCELSCVVFALHHAQAALGNLSSLSSGSLRQLGELPESTAMTVERFLDELNEEGIVDLSVGRVLAELDLRDRISYSEYGILGLGGSCSEACSMRSSASPSISSWCCPLRAHWEKDEISTRRHANQSSRSPSRPAPQH